MAAPAGVAPGASSALPPIWYRTLTRALEPWVARWGQGGDREALRWRRGLEVARADAWLHAASAGEASGVGPVVAEWQRRRPGERLALSALTPAGRAALRRSHPALAVGAPPFDSIRFTRRALAESGVRRLVLFESELWPAWLAAALERGVRVAVVNGRLSDRSWPKTKLWSRLFRPAVARFSAVAAQTAIDAERWIALGARAERVHVSGNTKYDVPAEVAPPLGEPERHEARARLGLETDHLWCVWGSLRPGEERWLAAALADPRLGAWRHLVVPRHPDRWPPRSRTGEDSGRARWLLGLGILEGAYRAADTAVIGGTLESYGGHNPVEPARLAVPILLGPSVENCREAAATLRAAGGAVAVTTPADLARGLAAWGEESARTAAGWAAWNGAQELRGATVRTLDWLEACGMWS